MTMRLLSLFSGVGGLDAAVSQAFGATVVAHCEADPYCRQVLARHWPGVPCFEDVRALTAADVGAIDCICGGFPCTDLSTAGKQAGLQAARSGLWWEYLRLVTELRPSIVVIENVPPLYRRPDWRWQVEGPLVALGYRVIWTLCRASDVGAPHRRERTFALAVLPGVAVPMVRPVVATAGGVFWPTPQAFDSTDCPSGNMEERKKRGGCSNLREAVQPNGGMCPTPTARDGNGAGTGPAAAGADSLATQACRATPCTRDWRSESGRRDNGHTPNLSSIGLLNAAWTESLVGLPVGWTEADGDPMQIDFAPAWPAGRGQQQHDWEPPRTVPPKTGKDRRKRLMALGNIVVPQQAMLALSRLAAAANDPTACPMGGDQLVLL